MLDIDGVGMLSYQVGKYNRLKRVYNLLLTDYVVKNSHKQSMCVG